ncbi:MAG: leucine-rich repeat protein [Bacteroidales bacterium]|nr:leucine-rich repeat protein [Bacteroidales bacterium]
MRKLFLIMVAILFGFGAGNNAFAQSGTCGANLTWTLDNGTLTISGTGAMYNFGDNNQPWYNYRTIITDVIIGDSVTTIGAYAFGITSLSNGYNSLMSVIIGNSVTKIGFFAFLSCSGLTSITIPNSVTEIGSQAFFNCLSLTSVTMSNAITSIMAQTFTGCSSLMSVTIPNSVTEIGGMAFMGCSSLTSIIIPNSVTSIGNYAFLDCSLIEITSNAITPPTLGISVFYSTTNIPVYVPCGSITAYQNANGWNYFTNYNNIPTNVPENISVVTSGNANIISWYGETETYELYRNNALLATIVDTNYTDSDVINGVEYCYKIRAIFNECGSELSEPVCITFNSLNDVEAENSLVIYPNPATSNVIIDCTDKINSLEIVNLLGQQVYSAKVDKNNTMIDVSNFAKGNYVAKIYTDKGVTTKKFVVE